MALGGALGPGLVARDARGAAPLLRGRRGAWWGPPWFHVAGVAQSHIHGRFAWQEWHLWHWVAPLGPVLSRVTPVAPRHFCVAGVALGDIHLDFTWQEWHNRTSTVVLRGRRLTHGMGGALGPGLVARDARGAAPLLRGRRGTWWHPPWFHVASVAQSDIHGRFAWQAWHLWYWVARLGPDLSPKTPRRFAWQAWHLVTSTFVSRGSCVTNSHPRSFCVAGVALMALGGALGPGFVARDAAAVCVAGVALGDIHFRFTWQVWHLVTSTLVLRGRRGTISHRPSFCVAGVAPSLTHPLSHTTLSHTIFHTPSFTPSFVTHHLSRTIFHTPLCHPPSLTHHLSHTTLSHTIFDTPSFTHHLCNTPSFTHHLLHPTLSNTIFDTPYFTHHFVTHHFVTHHLSPHHLPHTIFHHPIFHTQLCHTPSLTHHLSHTTLSHTVFHTQLCHTLSFTQNFHPHHLSHTTLSHTIFHTTILHTHNFATKPSFATPSFTHHFVTHHLSHTTLSHALFHTQLSHTHTPSFTHCFATHTHTIFLRHTPSFTFHFVTNNCFNFSILHRLLSLTFFPRPCYNLSCLLLEEVDLWGYPVL